MANSVEDYSTTAASNTGEFPENQNPSTVNDGMRKVQAHIAALLDQLTGDCTVGGTVDAITATFSPAHTAHLDKRVIVIRAAGANATTTPTFQLDALTAYTITKNGNQSLSIGDIYGAGHQLVLQYNSTNTVWELLNPAIPAISPGDYYITDTISGNPSTSATYEKVAEIRIGVSGTYRVRTSLSNGTTGTSNSRVYKNGSAVGTEQTEVNPVNEVFFNQDLSFLAGDLIQLYVRTTAGSVQGTIKLGVSNPLHVPGILVGFGTS